VLPLERDRRALRIVLIVAAGRSVRDARHDAAELPLEFGDLLQRLIAGGLQPGTCRFWFSHQRRISLIATILTPRLGIIPAHLAL
jgi:hypothetical protein